MPDGTLTPVAARVAVSNHLITVREKSVYAQHSVGGSGNRWDMFRSGVSATGTAFRILQERHTCTVGSSSMLAKLPYTYQ